MSAENVSDRFRGERLRLGLGHAEVAAICGASRRAVINWEKGAKIPAEALAALMPKGMDVIYVLAGRTQDAPQPMLLSPDEADLVTSYRALSEEAQGKVRAYLTAALELGVRKGTARGVRKKKEE